MQHVDKWNMDMYPDKENGVPGSDCFRLQYLDYDGMIQWTQKDIYDGDGKPTGQTKPHDMKIWDVTGLGSRAAKNKKLKCVASIAPEDLRVAEEKIGGKPTIVQMALWYEPQFAGDGQKILKWVALDRKKVLRPKYWRNVTEEYYKSWRPKAYEEFPDPFQDVPRPSTRVADLEKENAELANLRAQNLVLQERLKAKGGNA